MYLASAGRTSAQSRALVLILKGMSLVAFAAATQAVEQLAGLRFSKGGSLIQQISYSLAVD
jgi:hypothetical protein